MADSIGPSYGKFRAFRGARRADTDDMTEASVTPPGAGARVIIVRLSTGQPVQEPGSIAKVRDQAVAVRVEHAGFATGEEVVCITVERPRLSVRARFLAAQGSLCAFQLIRPWRILEVRESERHAASLAAEVRSVLGTSRQTGELVDISSGGAGVVVPSRPGGRQLEVLLSAGGYSATLPCELADAEEHADGILLHLKFAELSPAQQAFVRGLIAAVQAARVAMMEAAS